MCRTVLIPTIIAAIGLAGCGHTVDPTAERAAIADVLKAYVAAVEAEDWDAYSKVVSHGLHDVNFGAFGEPIVGWAALESVIQAQFQTLSDVAVDVSDLRVSVSPAGDIAWATSQWVFKAAMGSTPLDLKLRCSWVLDKVQGKWQVVHFHKSIAAG